MERRSGRRVMVPGPQLRVVRVHDGGGDQLSFDRDTPRLPRQWESDGHIPRRRFREQVLKPALARAGIGVDVKMHALRHAHASWLAGGADLQVVKERLGHGSITTTERYLRTCNAIPAQHQHHRASRAPPSSASTGCPLQRLLSDTVGGPA